MLGNDKISNDNVVASDLMILFNEKPKLFSRCNLYYLHCSLMINLHITDDIRQTKYNKQKTHETPFKVFFRISRRLDDGSLCTERLGQL